MAGYVWYACYGSNLLYERFMCYITGGKAPGSSHVNPGARDRTPPVGDELYRINRRLYFGETSKAWQNRGVAFIEADPDEQAVTLSRIYRITHQQFEDVLAQENRKKPGSLDLRLQDLDPGDSIKVSDSWYGRLICVELYESEPVLTFTSPADLPVDERREPSVEYLTVIINGLLETQSELPDSDIVAYFMQTEAGMLGEDVIRDIIDEWRSRNG